ncbi:MAG: Metallophos protein [Candidatus Hydrogenedentes bacterium]|nr:Metallophos protein [Candidatus Hydrogenedentota bacterium]
MRRWALSWAAVLLLLAAGCPGIPLDQLLPAQHGQHWLRFVQVTDIHVTDEESPARMVTLDPFIYASWRSQEAYTPQVLDATIREINRIHWTGYFSSPGKIDFVIFTGDMVDNAQWNEFRWFMDIVDGGTVMPDSGELDGPLAPLDPEFNPNLPFTAQGLAKDIPWYLALGNHDLLGLGNFAVNYEDADAAQWFAPVSPTVASFVGLTALDPPQQYLFPTGDQSLAILLAGSPPPFDPHTYQIDLAALPSGYVPPDPARHYLSRESIIRESFNTRSFPGGHGFSWNSLSSGRGYYSFKPKKDVPVRVIVLDTMEAEAMEGYIGADGAISYVQFDGFLKPEVNAARTAGEYVIVVTHHPSASLKKITAARCVTPAEFTGYLTSEPNIVAHICGHVHYSATITHDGPHPYPEIITCSLIDYPQQARLIDLYFDPGTKTFDIRSTPVSHIRHATELSAESYVRMTSDTLVDPESPEWLERSANLDLSSIESIIQEMK